jgi:anti-sigma B factor antagonist
MPIESKEIEGGVAVIAVSGRLTFGREAERLEGLVTELLKGGKTRFVLDVSGLDYVDSSGIGTVVSCLTQVKKSGADLRMAGASPRIQRLFSMTGIDKLLTLYPTVAEAAGA